VKSKINIFNHELVPKHILLTEDEKNNVMKKYGIKRMSQFPKILKSDPVVNILGAKIGDLIKIIRKSETAKESVYYRVVIEG